MDAMEKDEETLLAIVRSVIDGSAGFETEIAQRAGISLYRLRRLISRHPELLEDIETERLRILYKALHNVARAVASGDVSVSLELLRLASRTEGLRAIFAPPQAGRKRVIEIRIEDI